VESSADDMRKELLKRSKNDIELSRRLREYDSVLYKAKQSVPLETSLTIDSKAVDPHNLFKGFKTLSDLLPLCNQASTGDEDLG